MGSFGLWHWLLTLLWIVIPAIVVWLFVRASRRRQRQGAGDLQDGAGLRELSRLRQRGVLTEEEFERKRAELGRNA